MAGIILHLFGTKWKICGILVAEIQFCYTQAKYNGKGGPMALTFEIKHREDNGLELTIPQIAELENLSYGAMDNEFCLDFGEIGKFTIMYKEDSIGRGFEVSQEADRIAINMPLPNTETDIRTAFSLVQKLCEKLGTDSFVCDDEIVLLSSIPQKTAEKISVSESGFKMLEDRINEDEHNSFIIFGAVNPVTVGAAELAECGGTLAGFEKLLHRLQSMDVYYASPKYYQLKDGAVFGLFFVRDNVMTVLPKNPSSMNGPIENLKGYYVHLPDDNDVPYEAFKANVVPAGDYDTGHVMVCLTENNIAFLAENCTVAIDTDNPRKGIYWGRIVDNGFRHENKIKTMQLSAPELSGYNHLAVFLRWAAENDLLSDMLKEAIPDIDNIIRNQENDLRKLIMNHPAFRGYLRSFHFKKEARRFVNRFYVFNRDGYPSCVDDYAEKVLGSERYNCAEYKNEGYLFAPYGEKYYKGLSKYITKEWKKYR